MVSDTSSTGTHQIHQDGDQRNALQSEIDQQNNDNRFHQGNAHSHNQFDPKDQRSIANRLAAEEQRNREGDDEDSEQTKQLKKDPTLPAKMHGNNPSRGAEIDAELQAEEEEELKRKGKA